MFLYKVPFYIELNTTLRLFDVALEAYGKVVSVTCKKFLNSDRAVPQMCTCERQLYPARGSLFLFIDPQNGLGWEGPSKIIKSNPLASSRDVFR